MDRAQHSAPSSSSKVDNHDKYLPPPEERMEAVRVVVRCRPLTSQEVDRGHTSIVECDTGSGAVHVRNPKTTTEPECRKTFTFDAVLDVRSRQEDVFRHVEPLVSSVLAGENATVLAYGQTGAGKTHTMEGCLGDAGECGIITRSFQQIFQQISVTGRRHFLVRCSYLEIYNEEIRDLLSPDSTRCCDVRESQDGGVVVTHLSWYLTTSVQEMMDNMAVGNRNRSVGETDMNKRSSRSHAIFTVLVETEDLEEQGVVPGSGRAGKLSLVDLAGSERQPKTGSNGLRLREAVKINLSLTTLGKVITALVAEDRGTTHHVPYRESKLTRLLRDSLGGNARTLMVANIGPSDRNYEETVQTLRYGQRVKMIENRPRVNADPANTLVEEYKREIGRLKELLAGRLAMRLAAFDREMRPAGGGEGAGLELPEAVDVTEKENEKVRQLEYKEQLEREIAEDQMTVENMEARITMLESKFLCGGRDIEELTLAQGHLLDERRLELEARCRTMGRMRDRLSLREEHVTSGERLYADLRQEVEATGVSTDQYTARWTEVWQRIGTAVAEFSRDRRELEDEIRELHKQRRKNEVIIQNFIPDGAREELLTRMSYDAAAEDWTVAEWCATEGLEPVGRRGRHRSRRSRLSGGGGGGVETAKWSVYQPWHRTENSLSLDLYSPERSTQDYRQPSVKEQLQRRLEEAIELDDNDGCLEVDADPRRRRERPGAGDGGIFLRRPRERAGGRTAGQAFD